MVILEHQIAFGIGEGNKLQLNALDNLFNRLGEGKKISEMVFSRKTLQSLPLGGRVVVNLLDSNNRQLHFFDDQRRLYDSRPFDRKSAITGLALAVAMIPQIDDLNQPVIKADLKALTKKLTKGGGLIILEKAAGEPRRDILSREETDLIKPKILAPKNGVRLWETRRAVERDTTDFAAVMAYNNAVTDLADNVGIHTFEDLNGNAIVVDWSRHGVTTSKIGDDVGDTAYWRALAVKNGIKLPELTEKQRRLRYALMIRSAEKAQERGKYLITEDMFSSQGVPIRRFCSSGEHVGPPQPLIATLRKDKVERGHLKTILVNISCPNHGTRDDPKSFNVKSHTRTVNGELKTGWILVNRVTESGNGAQG